MAASRYRDDAAIAVVCAVWVTMGVMALAFSYSGTETFLGFAVAAAMGSFLCGVGIGTAWTALVRPRLGGADRDGRPGGGS